VGCKEKILLYLIKPKFDDSFDDYLFASARRNLVLSDWLSLQDLSPAQLAQALQTNSSPRAVRK